MVTEDCQPESDGAAPGPNRRSLPSVAFVDIRPAGQWIYNPVNSTLDLLTRARGMHVWNMYTRAV